MKTLANRWFPLTTAVCTLVLTMAVLRQSQRAELCSAPGVRQIFVLPVLAATSSDAEAHTPRFRSVLFSAADLTVARIRRLQHDGVEVITLAVGERPEELAREQQVSREILDAGLELRYWIEVARCPILADAHPEWMASLQGHPEWRRLFPQIPEPTAGDVVRVYPWVPIVNREPFDGQLARITTLLNELPTPSGLFLNDLQGAPSACGCGHHLCRWTSDYGSIRTTSPLGPTAARQFVAALEERFAACEIVPVWTTECEEHDGAATGLCAGVGCFNGTCWKAWTEQLAPVAELSPRLGVLLPYKAFQRDLPIYGSTAQWIQHAVTSFQSMPLQYRQEPVNAGRLIAILQGWNVTESEIAAQVAAANRAGCDGYVIAYSELQQSWHPRITLPSIAAAEP